MLPGFFDRLKIRHYNKGLTLHIADRFDQICLKLFASIDQGPHSKHFADLQQLQPTTRELEEAVQWVKTQDASKEFLDDLEHAALSLCEDHHG